MRVLSSILLCAALLPSQTEQLRVGSKKFTESVILGEMVRILAYQSGAQAEHLSELGGTRLVYEALLSGAIDVYPDYTGTLRLEIFKDLNLASDEELPAALAARGLRMSAPLGFSNSYGIAAKEAWAQANGVERISDLIALGDLTLGCSHEFLERGDGFPALRQHYGLQLQAQGLDHDLAYAGMAADSFPLIVVYTTEPEIDYHGLRVLEDDRSFFPDYHAVLLYRDDVADSAAMREVLRLCGRIDNQEMIRLNLAAKPPSGGGVPENVVADGFVSAEFGTLRQEVADSLADRVSARTWEQLLLVGVSLLLAVLLAVPAGIWAARHPALGQVVLGVCGVLQTIPSLALLVFLIPFLKLGAVPAIAALFVYSLLPILRNTHSGLQGIPGELLESADALGLSRRARLLAVELPIALPSILTGIKTAVVINIGTATLGAFIGAGGYGQPILTGIRLDDYGRVLEGALPAAAMAVLAQLLLDYIERLVVSPGLRR